MFGYTEFNAPTILFPLRQAVSYPGCIISRDESTMRTLLTCLAAGSLAMAAAPAVHAQDGDIVVSAKLDAKAAKELRKLEKRRADLLEDIETYEKKAAKAQEQLSDAREDLSEAEREMRKAKDRHSDSERRLAKERGKLAEIEQRLARLTAASDARVIDAR